MVVPGNNSPGTARGLHLAGSIQSGTRNGQTEWWYRKVNQKAEGMKCRQSQRPDSTDDGGEPSPSGPVRGKRGVMLTEPLVGNDGEYTEIHKHVDETTMDSRAGEKVPAAGFHIVASFD